MSKIYTSAILILVIVGVVNLLSEEFYARFDFTEGKQYTLSDATEVILSDLVEPVTVKAYFSEDLPPDVQKVRQDFQDMLIEYSNLSDGMLIYEFVNPNQDEQIEQEAAQNGIQPVMINIRDKDQMKQQKAFLGALVTQGEVQETLPFIQPGAAMEYTLSMAIKKISAIDKKTIGFLTGHGEAPLNEMQQLMAQLQVLYNAVPISLDSGDVPSYINTLAIIAPSDTIPPMHFARLDNFLKRGGKMVVGMNRVTGDLQSNYGRPVNTGLENWLMNKGIEVKPNFVIDAKCATVTVQQQQQFFTVQSQVAFPFLPIVGKFADHPVSSGLETVVFEFASPVAYLGDTTKKFTPLLFTSELSNSLPSPQYFDINKEWTEDDLPMDGITIGGAIEGNLAGDTYSKMVVFSDGDFVVNGPQQQAQPLQPDNINLMSNAIDWLSDDTGLIALRTKSVTSRPIAELEEATKFSLKLLNFGLPILLAIAYGVFRFQRNRILRLKRMGLNYEKDQ